VKFKGPFTWHHHDIEDEMFLVVKGRFRMELRDRNVELDEGEFIDEEGESAARQRVIH
jgi:mannose-6-phosphate isomerase-like protein (cupin superfamily)